MSNKQTIKPLSLLAGTVFTASIAATPVAHADVNPFAISTLSSGYMLADKGTEGQCGANKRVNEAECGANKAVKKVNEAECGADKPKPIVEAKCGEAKCGNNK